MATLSRGESLGDLDESILSEVLGRKPDGR